MLPSLFDRGAVPKAWRSEIAIHLETFSYILTADPKNPVPSPGRGGRV